MRDLDVVVFGATGFVGRLTAQHLARHAPIGTKIALGGRSLTRLESVRAELGVDWPLVVADTGDPAALRAMAERTTVVATTVGPYARYGLPLVQACAAAGTHYADLAGEVLFVRDSIDAHHEAAVASGARIVHACGFDSVPSDLAVLLLHGEGGELEATTLLLASARGGFSGGTIDSLRNQVEVSKADTSLKRVAADPYALSPSRADEPDLGGEGDSVLPRRDDLLGRWVAPFVMAPFNTRIVRRSNALQDWAYGRRFRYTEVMGVGPMPVAPVLASAVSAGLVGLGLGMAFRPARLVLDRVLPKPGQGPSEQTRENGHFRTQTHARTADGRHLVATVAAKGDPGYAATAVMLGQSALSLALDELPGGGGVRTPATAMGTALVERLRAQGFELTVTEVAR